MKTTKSNPNPFLSSDFIKKHGFYFFVLLFVSFLGLYINSINFFNSNVPYALILTIAADFSIVFSWFVKVKSEFIKKIGDNRFDSVVIILLSFLVFALCIVCCPDRVTMISLPDEYGYFSIASHLAGYDVSDIASLSSYYYSYGYSLILVPLFLIFDDFEIIFTATQIINAVITSFLVPLCFFLIKKFSKGEINHFRKSPILMPIIIFSLMAACVIGYSSWGKGEVLLIMLTLITACLIYKILDLKKRGRVASIITLSLVLVYGYTVHQRFIGVIAALMITALVMVIFKRIKLKDLCVLLFSFALFYIVHYFFKGFIIESIWGNGENALTNDTGDSLPKMFSLLFDRGNFTSFLTVFIGQTFYLGAASLMTAWFALHCILRESFYFIKDIVKLKSQKNDETEKDKGTEPPKIAEFDFVILFTLLASVFTMIISAIFLSSPSRGDHIIFGRYNNMFIALLGVFILTRIVTGRYKLSKSSLVVSVLFVLSMAFTDNVFHTEFANTNYLSFSAVNITIFKKMGDMFIWYGGSLALLVGLFMLKFGDKSPSPPKDTEDVEVSVDTAPRIRPSVITSVLMTVSVFLAANSYDFAVNTETMRGIRNSSVRYNVHRGAYDTFRKIRASDEGKNLPICVAGYSRLNNLLILDIIAFDMDVRYTKTTSSLPSGDFLYVEFMNAKNDDVLQKINSEYEKSLIDSNDSFKLYKCVKN